MQFAYGLIFNMKTRKTTIREPIDIPLGFTTNTLKTRINPGLGAHPCDSYREVYGFVILQAVGHNQAQVCS